MTSENHNRSKGSIEGTRRYARPEHRHCGMKLHEMAKELLAQGYDHRTIAEAALDLGLYMSKVKFENYLPYLQLIEKMAHNLSSDFALPSTVVKH